MVMPGQFQQYVLVFNLPHILRINKFRKRLQDLYSQEFSIFKPDKKLKWLPHLGTVRLELQLDDRTVEADVPPLEAAFIEMFSNKGEFAILLRTEMLVALWLGSVGLNCCFVGLVDGPPSPVLVSFCHVSQLRYVDHRFFGR